MKEKEVLQKEGANRVIAKQGVMDDAAKKKEKKR